MLNEGDKVPLERLENSAGDSFSLAEYFGKPLVIYFYPKADTPGCTSEAQAFTAHADAFAAKNITVIGVSKDKPAKLKKFSDKYGLRVLLASDERGGFCEAFGTWVEKSMYGRSYMGIERSTFLIGEDGTILRVWPKVKVKGHAEDVLAAVGAI